MRLVLDSTHLEVELTSFERLAALQHQVRFPLSSVISVDYRPVAREAISGLRAPGTAIPRRVALGTWRTLKRKSFIAVRSDGPGYEIKLKGERFDTIVVESDPIPALDDRFN